jgi:N-methylhydantoinase B/oxoprolinase/acetone carboxylase alpha subunit
VRQSLPSKVMNFMLQQGDILRLETSGGGGFGEPRQRPRGRRGLQRAEQVRQLRRRPAHAGISWS